MGPFEKNTSPCPLNKLGFAIGFIDDNSVSASRTDWGVKPSNRAVE